jgi:hypothetical protein
LPISTTIRWSNNDADNYHHFQYLNWSMSKSLIRSILSLSLVLSSSPYY